MLALAAGLRAVDLFVLRLDERVGELPLSAALTLLAIAAAATLTGSGIRVAGFHDLENNAPIYLAGAVTLIAFGLGIALQWLLLRAGGADATLSIEAADPAGAGNPRWSASGERSSAPAGADAAQSGAIARARRAAAAARVGQNTFGLVVLVSGVVGALAEEVLFRGLVLGLLANEFGLSGAVILQAFLYGAWQLVWPAKAVFAGQASFNQALRAGTALFGVSTMIGIAFGAMRVVAGTLWVPILVHVLNNAVSTFVHLRTARGRVADRFMMQGVATLGLLAVAPILHRLAH